MCRLKLHLFSISLVNLAIHPLRKLTMVLLKVTHGICSKTVVYIYIYAFSRRFYPKQLTVLVIQKTFYIYIYAFSRRFYPKRLTIAFRLYIFIITCVPWESNPQPFAQLTQCSTTEPHRNTTLLLYNTTVQFYNTFTLLKPWRFKFSGDLYLCIYSVFVFVLWSMVWCIILFNKKKESEKIFPNPLGKSNLNQVIRVPNQMICEPAPKSCTEVTTWIVIYEPGTHFYLNQIIRDTCSEVPIWMKRFITFSEVLT